MLALLAAPATTAAALPASLNGDEHDGSFGSAGHHGVGLASEDDAPTAPGEAIAQDSDAAGDPVDEIVGGVLSEPDSSASAPSDDPGAGDASDAVPDGVTEPVGDAADAVPGGNEPVGDATGAARDAAGAAQDAADAVPDGGDTTGALPDPSEATESDAADIVPDVVGSVPEESPQESSAPEGSPSPAPESQREASASAEPPPSTASPETASRQPAAAPAPGTPERAVGTATPPFRESTQVAVAGSTDAPFRISVSELSAPVAMLDRQPTAAAEPPTSRVRPTPHAARSPAPVAAQPSGATSLPHAPTWLVTATGGLAILIAAGQVLHARHRGTTATTGVSPTEPPR